MGVSGAQIVVAAALVDAAGRVLIQRRPAGKRHGGLWEFPGGKIEPGESPEAALVRELAEELGITVATDACRPLGFASDPDLILLLFVVRDWRGEPRALDADAVAWHPAAALLDLPMPPADRPLVAALLEARAGIEPACKDLQSSA